MIPSVVTGTSAGKAGGAGQLASVVAGGPAPLIATALLAGSGYTIAGYIAFCAVVSIIATALLPDYTNRDISQEHA